MLLSMPYINMHVFVWHALIYRKDKLQTSAESLIFAAVCINEDVLNVMRSGVCQLTYVRMIYVVSGRG